MGMEFVYKYGGLLLLTLQQASMPLLARYTRDRSSDEVFITTVNVFMMEVTKLVVCSSILLYTLKNPSKFLEELRHAIYDQKVETIKVCIPALIYTLQNNLYYIALSHLEATTFCVAYQMKIFTTALLMRLMLGKKLSTAQWAALTLLVAGVVDVQLVYSPPSSSSGEEQSPLYGFGAVVLMCITSPLAGVYLEKVLKGSETSVWMQNIRLALIGLPISVISIWMYDYDKIIEGGFFRGWDFSVATLTVVNSVGGLLIAVVMKYADNILKAYAQSMAIVGAAVGSWMLFDFIPNFQFSIGAFLVMVSIVLYTANPYTPPRAARFDLRQLSASTDLLLTIKPNRATSK